MIVHYNVVHNKLYYNTLHCNCLTIQYIESQYCNFESIEWPESWYWYLRLCTFMKVLREDILSPQMVESESKWTFQLPGRIYFIWKKSQKWKRLAEKVAKRRATVIMTNEAYPSTLCNRQHFKSNKSTGKVEIIQIK